MVFGLKLLLPILLLWGLAYVPLRAALRGVLDAEEFHKRYLAVLACTIPNFIAIKPELFFVFMAIGIWFAQRLLGGDTRAKIASFWMAVILFVPIHLELGGVGGINYLLSLDHFKLAAIVLLVPAAFSIPKRSSAPRPGTLLLDMAVLAYPLFDIAITAPGVSLTGSVRSLVVVGLDVALPYFVLTRGLRTWADFKYVLVSLLTACLFAAAVGFLEFCVQRNIYSDLQWALGVKWSLTHTLLRGNLVRVQAMTPQPILYAVQLMFTFGLWWAVARGQVVGRGLSRLVDLMLVCVLVFTFSRGPWLGTAVFGVTLLALTRLQISVVATALVATAIAAVTVKLAGLDDSILAALKVVFGSTQEESGSIEYRKQLLDTAIALVKQSPWFGVPNYAAQMQSLVQGEGIIDLVNAYVGVSLNSGLIGLVCYLAPFLVSLSMLFRRLGVVIARDPADELRYRRVATALLIGLLLTIFTTSSWERLPFLMLFLFATPAVAASAARGVVTPIESVRAPDSRLAVSVVR